jgi:hypothetical protein
MSAVIGPEELKRMVESNWKELEDDLKRIEQDISEDEGPFDWEEDDDLEDSHRESNDD